MVPAWHGLVPSALNSKASTSDLSVWIFIKLRIIGLLNQIISFQFMDKCIYFSFDFLTNIIKSANTFKLFFISITGYKQMG